ncbi:MAG: hypothetical protein HZC24_11610, partial [Rhodocyclales bacterium]|nr:hypothetical protein [Rhodocyclales bacterium]
KTVLVQPEGDVATVRLREGELREWIGQAATIEVVLEARMRNGDVRLVAEVLPFLVGEWLAHHIAFEDQRYAGYIGSHTSKLHQKYASAADLYPWRQSESELAEA